MTGAFNLGNQMAAEQKMVETRQAKMEIRLVL